MVSRITSIFTIALYLYIPTAVTAEEIKCSAIGWTFIIVLEDKLFRDAPKWKETSEWPPIPPRKAIRLAQDKFRDLKVERKEDYEWTSKTMWLRQYRDGDWYWEVSFVPLKKTGQTGNSGSLVIVVLMDGSVPDIKAVKP